MPALNWNKISVFAGGLIVFGAAIANAKLGLGIDDTTRGILIAAGAAGMGLPVALPARSSATAGLQPPSGQP